jgi:L-fucose mutarotase
LKIDFRVIPQFFLDIGGDWVENDRLEEFIMLIGIDPVISPELLDTLFRMGHGDEIVLADAFFPGDSTNARVIRADGIKIPALLDGILALMNLDSYVPHPLAMMAPVTGDALDESVEKSYRAAIERHWPGTPPVERVERFAFYERAKKAFAVIMTGETVKYGNIILKKGVIPIQ